ncbi:MAG: hypothetical protein MUE61_19155 [Vicinamibacterales bacterium]|nr:hypothetical protein [Vicinamibacterales bacterium]
MDVNRRQLVLLGAILVVLAAVLVWQSTRREATPEEFSAAMSQTAPEAAGPAAQARPRPTGPDQIPAVNLAGLGRAQPEPADTGRDPFRFESAPAAGQRGAITGPGAGAPPPQAVMPAGPQEPPGPPPVPLKFIGFARQGQGRLYAVLRDERGVYYGAVGDVVEGRYRILRVAADAIEVAYVDGRGRTTIPLSGGRP